MIIVGVRNTDRNRDLTTDSSQLSKEQKDRISFYHLKLSIKTQHFQS